MKNCTHVNKKMGNFQVYGYLFIFILFTCVLFFVHKPIKVSAAGDTTTSHLPYVVSQHNNLDSSYFSALDNVMLSYYANVLQLTTDSEGVFVYTFFDSNGLNLCAIFPRSADASFSAYSPADFIYNSYQIDSSSSSGIAFFKSGTYGRCSITIKSDGTVLANNNYSGNNFPGYGGFNFFPLTYYDSTFGLYENQIVKTTVDIYDQNNNLIITKGTGAAINAGWLATDFVEQGSANDFKHDGFYTKELSDIWSQIKNFFPDFVPITPGMSFDDLVVALLKDFLYFVSKILEFVLKIYDNILAFFRNFWTNLKNLLTYLAGLISGLFVPEDAEEVPDDPLSVFKWFETNLAAAIFGKNVVSQCLDSDGFFNFVYLVFPQNFEWVLPQFTSFINTEFENSTGFVNQMYNAYTNNIARIHAGVVPTFTIPAFTISGVTIPGQIIDFSFLTILLPTIHSFIFVFMWFSFTIYIIKEAPSIIRGVSSSTVDTYNVSERM